MNRLLAVCSLGALVVLSSCLPGAKAPQVTPTRTLDLAGEGGPNGTTKAFAVVFASPKGATVDPSEVTIVFNRPMRPMDLADGTSAAGGVVNPGAEAAPPAAIAIKGGGAPKGSWRWMGTGALV